jgi:hypothetical protein
MADSGAIRAGKAYVEMSTNDAGLKSGLDRAKSAVMGFAKDVGKIAAGIGVAKGAEFIFKNINEAFSDAVGHITEVRKAAEQIGSSAESVSAMGYAAQKAGVDLEGMTTASRHLNAAILEAAQGGGPLANIFQQLGISAKQLEGASLEDKFAVFAEALKRLPNETERQVVAMQALGRAGVNLIPILRGGSEGLAEIIEKGRDMGAIVSTEDAAKAKEYTKAIGQAKEAVKYFWEAVGASVLEVAGPIKETSDEFVSFMKGARKFAEENRSVVASVFSVVAAIVGGMSALAAVGTFFFVASSAASGLAAALGLLVSTPVLVATGFAAVAVVGAALVADFGDLEKMTTKLSEAGANLGEVWAQIAPTIAMTMKGVRDAIKGGNFDLAMKVATAGIEVVWQEMLMRMSKAWYKFQDSFVDSWHKVIYGSALILSDIDSWGVRNFGGPRSTKPADDILRQSNNADRFRDAQREKDRRAELDIANARLAAARAEFAARVGEAAAGVPGRPKLKRTDPYGTGVFDLGTLAAASRGTFSGYAANQSLGLESVQKNQLEVLKDIDEKLGNMQDNGGGLAFGQ